MQSFVMRLLLRNGLGCGIRGGIGLPVIIVVLNLYI